MSFVQTEFKQNKERKRQNSGILRNGSSFKTRSVAQTLGGI